MENLKMSFEVNISSFELMKRLDDLCTELELSTNTAIEIALDRFLNDCNEIVYLWTSKAWDKKRPYRKPKPGDIF